MLTRALPFLCVLLFLPAVPAAGQQQEDTLSLLFTGDVLLDRGVRPLVERMGTAYLFRHVASAFRRADAVVVNLECPLTSTASPVHKKYIFRGDTACAAGLRQAGVTHAAMANNHTNDQGRRGMEDTYRHLKAAGVTPLGYGRTEAERLTPVVVRRKGMDVALFNAVLFPSENWQPATDKGDVCYGNVERLAAAIRNYRSGHPSTPVVAVLHWGVEFQRTPHISQRIQARQLAEAGACAIVGHHPHVVQKMRRTRGIPVFYSLGNFVFDQKHPDACQAQMAVLRFTASDGLVGTETVPIRIEHCRPHIDN